MKTIDIIDNGTVIE